MDIVVIDRSGRHLHARGGAITEADSMHRRRQMAEQGDIDQMYRIGQSYFWGWGATRDKDEARRWFEKAAANGHEDARRKLEAYPP